MLVNYTERALCAAYAIHTYSRLAHINQTGKTGTMMCMYYANYLPQTTV